MCCASTGLQTVVRTPARPPAAPCLGRSVFFVPLLRARSRRPCVCRYHLGCVGLAPTDYGRVSHKDFKFVCPNCVPDKSQETMSDEPGGAASEGDDEGPRVRARKPKAKKAASRKKKKKGGAGGAAAPASAGGGKAKEEEEDPIDDMPPLGNFAADHADDPPRAATPPRPRKQRHDGYESFGLSSDDETQVPRSVVESTAARRGIVTARQEEEAKASLGAPPRRRRKGDSKKAARAFMKGGTRDKDVPAVGVNRYGQKVELVPWQAKLQNHLCCLPAPALAQFQKQQERQQEQRRAARAHASAWLR